jgi:hypothetical protein
MWKRAGLAIVVVLSITPGVSTAAGVIASLRSTGVDAAGQALSTGTDPHYTLRRIDHVGPWGSVTYDPFAPPAPQPGRAPAVFQPPLAARVVTPGASWVANSARSSWISQVSDGSSTAYGGHGRYVYQTTFDLTGHDPRGIEIAGTWGADDVGWMYLNLDDPVAPQRSKLVASCTAFWVLQPFSISGSNGLFRHGLNTLTFFTWDSGAGITGLRVDITTARSSVPEVDGAGVPCMVALVTGVIAVLERRRGRSSCPRPA